MHTENLILSSIPLENTTNLWKMNDILIFFIDLDNYGTLSMGSLNDTEKTDLEKLRTLYFKKRFIVSRTVLKHILCHLLGIESILEISTYKNRHGEVRVHDHEDLRIGLSYSENIIALAISKVKIGIDIEIKRPHALKNTLKYLRKMPPNTDNSITGTGFLKAWTVKEAYCKFSDESMLFFLNKEPDFSNASYFNFLLDDKYVFSIVTESGQYTISMSYLEKL